MMQPPHRKDAPVLSTTGTAAALMGRGKPLPPAMPQARRLTA
ncbi:hypothetical protein [uncultured Desulfovibrio sp.]|nr:hypothetical protein [uncultured Desulfovibrio sp.]